MCKMVPNTIDKELCMRHNVEADDPDLSALMAKHVDDLNMKGEDEILSYYSTTTRSSAS